MYRMAPWVTAVATMYASFTEMAAPQRAHVVTCSDDVRGWVWARELGEDVRVEEDR